MRRNNFSSAADRRWQRRYERIQQHKKEEAERKDLEELNAAMMDEFSKSLRPWQRELARASKEAQMRREEEWQENFMRWVKEHLQRIPPIVIDEVVPDPESEKELEAGDASVLDAFLENFAGAK